MMQNIEDFKYESIAIYNQAWELLVKKQYPRKNNLLATINAPIILDIVPIHETILSNLVILKIIVLFPLNDEYREIIHIVALTFSNYYHAHILLLIIQIDYNRLDGLSHEVI